MSVDIQPVIDYLKKQGVNTHFVNDLACWSYEDYSMFQDALNHKDMRVVRDTLEPVGVWYVDGEVDFDPILFANEDDAREYLIECLEYYIKDEYYGIKASHVEYVMEELLAKYKVLELEIFYGE